MDSITLQQIPRSKPFIATEILFESKYLMRQINYCDIFQLLKKWGIQHLRLANAFFGIKKGDTGI